MSRNYFSPVGRALLCAGLAICVTASIAPGWSSLVNISNTNNQFNDSAGWDFDASGNIHLVWHDFNNSPRLYYATNAGGSWQKSQVTTTVNGTTTLNITPQDQVMHLCYKANDRTYYRSKPVSGGSWSSAQRIDTDANWGFHTWSEINDNGDLLCLWLRLDWDVEHHLYARLKPYGGSWQTVEDVFGHGGENFPTVDWCGSHGNRFYACYSVNQWNGAWLRERSEAGVWATPVQVTAQGGAMSLAWSPVDGTMMASWAQPDDRCDLDWRVYVKFSADGGQSWYDQSVLSSICWLARSPACCFDGNGNPHVVWEDIPADGAKGEVQYRGRNNGTWSPQANLSNSTDRRSKPGLEAIKANNNRLHAVFSDNRNGGFEDIYYTHQDYTPAFTSTPTPTPTSMARPTLDTISLSSTQLVADGTTQYSVSFRAIDWDGYSDLKDMRVFFNRYPTDEPSCRGYLGWGQTSDDVTFFGDLEVQGPADGAGYAGFDSDHYGHEYITPRGCSTTTTPHTRTVTWTFSVNPLWYDNGPLTGNFFQLWARDAATNPYGSGWLSNDVNFAIVSPYRPVINSVDLSAATLQADGTTPYTVTLTVTDADGASDINDVRVLFNLDQSDQSAARGYLGWGATEADLTWFGSLESRGSATGGGRWGYDADGWGWQYITPSACSATPQATGWTLTWTFAVNPAWSTAGPLNNNEVWVWARDRTEAPLGTGWQKSSTTFSIGAESSINPLLEVR